MEEVVENSNGSTITIIHYYPSHVQEGLVALQSTGTYCACLHHQVQYSWLLISTRAKFTPCTLTMTGTPTAYGRRCPPPPQEPTEQSSDLVGQVELLVIGLVPPRRLDL